MKLTRLLSSLFTLTLSLGVFASAATPPPLPLNGPQSIAVDASGNLYVANIGGNNILKYNPAYVQQTAKTITKGINDPSGLAIDPYGNLWVANFLSNNITEYTAGIQNTSATLSLQFAGALAFDGLGNLWAQSGGGNLAIYSPTAVYAPPSHLVRTITPGGVIQSFTIGAGAFVYGTSTQTFLNSASSTLLGNPLNGGAFGFGAWAVAPDNKGNVYIAATDNNLYIAHPGGTAAVVVALPSTSGVVDLAIDNARGRVYFSDRFNNRILVYSTKGVLLHTIT